MSNIIVNEIEPCKLSVQYEADALQILNKRGDIINAFKKAPVPGYRAGKASLDAIKVHYRDQIEESLKRALAEDSYHNTLFEKKIKPHGPPRFNSMLMQDGKFSCEFELYTKPDFELAPYKELEVPKPHLGTNETLLSQKMLQELRLRFGEIYPYSETDFVQTGDNIIIDYECTLDGEKIPHLCTEGEMLTVGGHQLAAIDDHVLGMVSGETREFDFSVPEGGLPSLSGKTIHFKVTLSTGSKTVPCSLDDELAKKIGMKDFQEVTTFVNSAAMGKIAEQEKSMISEAVAMRLVEDNVINVPNWMTLSEAKYLAYNSKLEWEQISDQDKERFMQMSEKNVKLSLILDKVREVDPDAQISDNDVFEMIKGNLAKTKSGANLDEVIKKMNAEGSLQILFSRIKDTFALDQIVKTTKIVE